MKQPNSLLLSMYFLAEAVKHEAPWVKLAQESAQQQLFEYFVGCEKLNVTMARAFAQNMVEEMVRDGGGGCQ